MKLSNVRLSFPSLWVTEKYKGEDTGKFTASFLIPKDDPQLKEIKKAMIACAEAKWGKPLPKAVKMSALKDGDETEYDGYEGMMSVKCATQRRPVIVDRDKSLIVEADDKVYAGCYVNAVISFWAMDNQYGKKVLGNLDGIQFNAAGEPFGASNTAMDDFDELEPSADAPENEIPVAGEEPAGDDDEDPFDF